MKNPVFFSLVLGVVAYTVFRKRIVASAFLPPKKSPTRDQQIQTHVNDGSENPSDAEAIDRVEEALLESFPCSDAPAY
jgi:hypothetical protein